MKTNKYLHVFAPTRPMNQVRANRLADGCLDDLTRNWPVRLALWLLRLMAFLGTR